MADTLKQTLGGLGTTAVIGLGVLPDIISVVLGITTIIYFLIKINKELRK